MLGVSFINATFVFKTATSHRRGLARARTDGDICEIARSLIVPINGALMLANASTAEE
jgi:hypothetical protein